MSEQVQQEVVEEVTGTENNGKQIAKGIVLALTEDGSLVHEFIGRDGANIIEMEGLLEYGKKILDKRWDEIV